MLKLVLRKEDLMKVMGSIADHTDEWKKLVLDASIGDIDIIDKNIPIEERNKCIFQMKCPEHIRNEYIMTKEQIFKRYTPVKITKEVINNLGNYCFIVYDCYEEEWGTDYIRHYVEGVNYYNWDDACEIIKRLNAINIKPF